MKGSVRRFVISRVPGGHSGQDAADEAERAALAAGVELEVVAEPASQRRVLVACDDADAGRLRGSLSDRFRIEPEVHHAADERMLDLIVHAPDAARAIVMVRFERPDADDEFLNETTDDDGNATLIYADDRIPVHALVTPRHGAWTTCTTDFRSQVVIVNCEPLPEARAGIGWWHEAMGCRRTDPSNGRDALVGIVDSGCGPHPALADVTDVGAFIEGSHVMQGPHPGRDCDIHGTHVSGIIAAMPMSTHRHMGLAPGASVFSARVFGQAMPTSSSIDVANAIEVLSERYEVDLINLSLSSPQRSAVVLDAIETAKQRGVACICAVGNAGNAVRWPARSDDVIGVAAIGRRGAYPHGSRAREVEVLATATGTDYFAAPFSCRGQGVDCCAPGVGIISTVPNRAGGDYYLSMDGTSMAAPTVTAVLARMLSWERQKGRNPDSVWHFARNFLRECCHDIGLGADFQGGGLPIVPVAAMS